MAAAIEQIVDPTTRGDPMKPLRWVSKSLSHLVDELSRPGYRVSLHTVSKIRQEDWESGMPGLRQTREGGSHPDRDAPFQHLNRPCQEFQPRGQPVISVDSQKKDGWGISRTAVERGTRRVIPNRFAGTIFKTRKKARRRRRASMTSAGTQAG